MTVADLLPLKTVDDLLKVKDASGHEHGSDGRFGSGGGASAQVGGNPKKENHRIKALRSDGRVKDADGKKPCAECSDFAEVQDGYRKAAPGKYQLDGGAHYCGSHVVRAAEGREVTFNPDTGQYRRASADRSEGKPAKPKDPNHIKVPKEPEKCHGTYFEGRLCSTHGGSTKGSGSPGNCTTYQKKVREREEKLAERARAMSGTTKAVRAVDLLKIKDDEGHNHGDDGKFTSGSGGGKKVKPDKADAYDAFDDAMRSTHNETIEDEPKPKPKKTKPKVDVDPLIREPKGFKIAAKWMFITGVPHDHRANFLQVSANRKGGYNYVTDADGSRHWDGEQPKMPKFSCLGVKLRPGDDTAEIVIAGKNSPSLDAAEMGALFAKMVAEVRKTHPEVHRFSYEPPKSATGEPLHGAPIYAARKAVFDKLFTDGVPNDMFGTPKTPRLAAAIEETDIAKQQIFKQLTPEQRQEVQTAVGRELRACKYMPQKLAMLTDAPVKGAGSDGHALAWAMSTSDGAGIVKIVPSKEKWENLVRDTRIKTQPDTFIVAHCLPPEKRVGCVITHEMGHVLDNAIKHAISQGGPEGLRLFEKWKEMMDEKRKPSTPEQYHAGERVPSRYGATNEAEWFAESYAAYRYGLTVPPHARAFFEHIGVDSEIAKALQRLYVMALEGLDRPTYECGVLDGPATSEAPDDEEGGDAKKMTDADFFKMLDLAKV